MSTYSSVVHALGNILSMPSFAKFRRRPRAVSSIRQMIAAVCDHARCLVSYFHLDQFAVCHAKPFFKRYGRGEHYFPAEKHDFEYTVNHTKSFLDIKGIRHAQSLVFPQTNSPNLKHAISKLSERYGDVQTRQMHACPSNSYRCVQVATRSRSVRVQEQITQNMRNTQKHQFDSQVKL